MYACGADPTLHKVQRVVTAVGYEVQMKHERAGEATQAACTCNLEVLCVHVRTRLGMANLLASGAYWRCDGDCQERAEHARKQTVWQGRHRGCALSEEDSHPLRRSRGIFHNIATAIPRDIWR